MKGTASYLILSGLVSLTTASLNITNDVVLAVPKSQPPFAKSLDPNFVGMSLEFQYWPTYAGNETGKPNEYVNQLLNNLGDSTGKPTAVRVGGTSENTAYVDPSFRLWNASQLNEVFGPFTARSNTSIGRDWYVIAGNLPKGTEFTFGLNLYDQSEVAKQAQMLAEAFQGTRSHLTKDVSLKFVQVGNEPNFYFPDASTYVAHWTPLAKTVLRNLNMGGHRNPSFWVGSEIIGSFYPPFELTGTLEAGVLDAQEINAATDVLEEHLYSGAPSGAGVEDVPPPGTLMNKATIRSNLSAVYNGMLNSQSYGKEYYMGETNTYAGEGFLGLSTTGESAIWAVDYLLKLASMGVSRTYLHSTPNRKFAVFQPGWGFTNGTGIERPHVMPMYNGLLVVNEMIGKSGSAKIVELEAPDTSLASYGVWEAEKLSRIVLINSDVFLEGATTRTALNVSLVGGYKAGCTVVRRLSIPFTIAFENITSAGQSFETDSGIPSGRVKEEALNGNSIVVRASEVVLLSMNNAC